MTYKRQFQMRTKSFYKLLKGIKLLVGRTLQMSFCPKVIYKISISLLLTFMICAKVNAQKDTIFWFAAPEVARGFLDYDRPAVFRVSAFNEDVLVRLSQPANPSFVPRQIAIPAGQTGTFTFPPDFEFVENLTPNTVMNLGFLIEASSPVTAYYEVIGGCECNPEIFSLKGANALGTSFYVPFQEYLPNSRQFNHVPDPSADFCIVATEDNTQVTINPTAAIVGRAANSSFTITLNRGQTWTGKASSHLANNRPSGTSVVSNKNIAITMKDDLLDVDNIYSGGCRDLIGDQIVPIASLGNDYIVQRGNLVGPERAFIVAVQNNTTINISGVGQVILNAGQRYELVVTLPIYYIESSFPVYVLQVTGVGCEVSSAILPSFYCRGTNEVRFVRPTSEPLYLFLVTARGFENDFFVNNQAGIINGNSFTPVPGTNGEILASKILVENSDIPTGISTLVSNTSGVFQLGLLNGLESVTGTRFAYFSDFGGFEKIFKTDSLCEGKTLTYFDKTISEPGVYLDTIVRNDGCLIINELAVSLRSSNSAFEERTLCPGDSLLIGTVWVNTEGIFTDTIPSALGCDTIVFFDIKFEELSTEEIFLEACENEVITINGQSYSASTSFSDTLTLGDACLLIQNYTLDFLPLNTKSVDIAICEGDSVQIGNSFVYEPGVYIDTLYSVSSCDTVISKNVFFTDLLEREIEISGCDGDTLYFRGNEYTESVTDQIFAEGFSNCDTLFLIDVSIFELDEVVTNYTACIGEVVTINDIEFSSTQIYRDTIFSDSSVCPQIFIHNINFVNLEILVQDSIFFIDYGDTLELNPTIFSVLEYDFTWSPVSDNIDPFSLIQLIRVVQNQFFSLHIVDEIGCRQSMDFSITLLLPDCEEYLFIPNGITPNFDGINDKLGLFVKTECVTNIQVINIYNRWGDLVYSEQNPTLNDDSVGWDGSFKGNQLNPDVFVYSAIVTLYDDSTVIVSGEITLYR